MKIKHIVLASTILVSVSTFAQKDELKVLKKIYTKEAPKPADVAEYKTNLAKLEGVASEEADKVYAGFYKAMLPLVEISALGTLATDVQKSQIVTAKTIDEVEKGLNATLEFEKKSGKKVYTDDILTKIQLYKNEIINLAINLANQQKFQDASNVLYSAYLLDKKDQDNLFFAASYAINAVNYDLALEYYNELKKLNYTGETKVYFASTKADSKEESFGANKVLRDAAVSSGTHVKPREEKTPSRRGEIFKNIALILVEKGRVEEAKAAVAEARQANQEDTSLILTEADLYLKMNDIATYTKLVNEALEKNPNNVDLIYNLGVVAGNANKLDDAERYYKKALEINPNYFNANLNLAELKLRADDKFVTEINKLGTSEKDNKRYEVLKAEREKNFRTVLPYLEKAVELEPDNEPAKRTLISVYGALEMSDKAKALKATLKN